MRTPTSQHPPEPLRDGGRPRRRLITVRMMADAVELPERPAWVSSDRRARKRDRHDVVLVPVDDEDGTDNGAREAVEGCRP
jgi:hypothetical protein